LAFIYRTAIVIQHVLADETKTSAAHLSALVVLRLCRPLSRAVDDPFAKYVEILSLFFAGLGFKDTSVTYGLAHNITADSFRIC
jgi:hypothetical protein